MVPYYCLALPLSAKRCADWGNGDGLPYWIHPSEPDPPWLRNSKSERIPKPVICVIRILPWEMARRIFLGPVFMWMKWGHVSETAFSTEGGYSLLHSAEFWNKYSVASQPFGTCLTFCGLLSLWPRAHELSSMSGLPLGQNIPRRGSGVLWNRRKDFSGLLCGSSQLGPRSCGLGLARPILSNNQGLCATQ